MPFRIFFADGTTLDVQAANPTAARNQARKQREGVRITKVKVIKEPVA